MNRILKKFSVILLILLFPLGAFPKDINLSKYTINNTGPLKVPDSYFSQNLSPQIEDGELYTSSLSINFDNNNKYLLSLENKENDIPHTIVVSLHNDLDEYRNYILNFEDSTILDISLDKAIKEIVSGKSKKSETLSNQITISILCDFSFEGKLSVNKDYMESLKINLPDEVLARSLTTTITWDSSHCCPNTNGNKIYTEVVHESGTVFAWLKITKDNYQLTQGAFGDYYDTWRISVTAYYPTSNTILIYPDNSRETRCAYYYKTGIFGGSYYCSPSVPASAGSMFDPVYTKNYDNNGNLNKHYWYDLDDFVHADGPLTCVSYFGPANGDIWKMYNWSY